MQQLLCMRQHLDKAVAGAERAGLGSEISGGNTDNQLANQLSQLFVGQVRRNAPTSGLVLMHSLISVVIM